MLHLSSFILPSPLADDIFPVNGDIFKLIKLRIRYLGIIV